MGPFFPNEWFLPNYTPRCPMGLVYLPVPLSIWNCHCDLFGSHQQNPPVDELSPGSWHEPVDSWSTCQSTGQRAWWKESGENSPVEVGSEYPIIYKVLYIPGGFLRISEPATVSSLLINSSWELSAMSNPFPNLFGGLLSLFRRQCSQALPFKTDGGSFFLRGFLASFVPTKKHLWPMISKVGCKLCSWYWL